jgi:hypothetical protein
MASKVIITLAAIAFCSVTAASDSEFNQGSCSLDQDENCMAEQNYVSLLQAHSHFSVGRDSSFADKETAAAEARQAYSEIRDQLRKHPKVAKKALHDALIEVQQSTWPFTTGANQLFTADRAITASPATAAAGGKKTANTEAAPVAAVQQHAQSAHQKAPNASAPVDPEEPSAPVEASPSGAQIAPFGKEDTARELTQHAVDTQDTLVDAVENAEVAEVKRAVFRALTRLRAASIKEFDTIARLETQAFDEYNDAHHYRAENPLSYLHADEPQVTEDKFTSFH